jgi:hypothetical protein
MASRFWSRTAVAFLLVAVLQGARPALAAWSGYTAIGSGAVTSDISCAADGNGTGVCAALGSGGTLLVAHYNGTAWSGWTTETLALTSPPSCAEVIAGEVICASRNVTNEMVAYLWNGKTWTSPLAVAAGLFSGPSCAATASGKAVCAARSTSGEIVTAVYSGASWAAASWTRPALVSDAVYGPVKCTTDDVGQAICAYLTLGNATKVREFATSWSSAIDINGEVTAQPTTCTDAGVGGKAACFAIGTDTAVNGQLFVGGTFTAAHWTGWGSFNGSASSFSCAQYGQKAAVVNYACGAVSESNSGFYTNEYNGSSWAGWTQVGTMTFIGSPSCFALNRTVTPGRIMCALVTPANLAVTTIGP